MPKGRTCLPMPLKPYRGITSWKHLSFTRPRTATGQTSLSWIWTFIDGKFRDNVIAQIKNGPISFSPRTVQPVIRPWRKHPWCWNSDNTGISGILQPPRSFSVLCGRMSDSDTYVYALYHPWWTASCSHSLTAIAVSPISVMTSIGADILLPAANWYAFSRLSGNIHFLPSKLVKNGWGKLGCFLQLHTAIGSVNEISPKSDNNFISTPSQLSTSPRVEEAVVDYDAVRTASHLCMGHHYRLGSPFWCDIPMPSDWMPSYYHRADDGGIGFDWQQREQCDRTISLSFMRTTG